MANYSSTATLDFIAATGAAVDPAFAALPKYMKMKWTQMILSTIFRRLSYKQLLARAKKTLGAAVDARTMWKAAIQNGYLVKNVKAWLFWCAKQRLRGAAADKAGAAFKVKPEDYCLRLMMTNDCARHLQKLAERYPALTIERIDARVTEIFNDMREWLAKFVHKKMRFVYQQQGLEAHDMSMEVFAKGLHGLYLTYPVIESYLHAVNIVKSAAHNYGINIIMQQTHECRARIIKSSDNTFVTRVVALDDGVAQEIDNTIHEDATGHAEMRHDLERLFNGYAIQGCSSISFQWLLYESEALCTPFMSKKQRFLALLMGYEDWEFNQWLNSVHRIKSTGSEYLDKTEVPRFVKLVCQFLGVPEEKGHHFMARLQSRLRAYAP